MNGDAQIAFEVHRLYNELRPLLSSDAKRGLLDSLHRLVYTPPTMADVDWDDAVHAGLCAEHPVYGVVLMIGPDLVVEGSIICHWAYCDSPVTGRLMAEHLTPIPGTKIDLTPRREPDSSTDESSDGPGTINEDRNEGVETGNDAPKPRPQDVPVGEVWEVEAVGCGKWAGTRSNPGNTNSPWTLIRVDSCDYYWAKDDQVTPVRRLVPDTTPAHPTVLSTVDDYDSAPVGTIAADDDGAAVKAGDGTWRWTGSELSYRSDDLCYGESDPMTVVRWGK